MNSYSYVRRAYPPRRAPDSLTVDRQPCGGRFLSGPTSGYLKLLAGWPAELLVPAIYNLGM
jgi:hypothetical protein